MITWAITTNDRYVWELAYRSPNEYYKLVITKRYPLNIPNLPKPLVIEKMPEELGKRNHRMRNHLLMINVVKNKEGNFTCRMSRKGNLTFKFS